MKRVIGVFQVTANKCVDMFSFLSFCFLLIFNLVYLFPDYCFNFSILASFLLFSCLFLPLFLTNDFSSLSSHFHSLFYLSPSVLSCRFSHFLVSFFLCFLPTFSLLYRLIFTLFFISLLLFSLAFIILYFF